MIKTREKRQTSEVLDSAEPKLLPKSSPVLNRRRRSRTLEKKRKSSLVRRNSGNKRKRRNASKRKRKPSHENPKSNSETSKTVNRKKSDVIDLTDDTPPTPAPVKKVRCEVLTPVKESHEEPIDPLATPVTERNSSPTVDLDDVQFTQLPPFLEGTSFDKRKQKSSSPKAEIRPKNNSPQFLDIFKRKSPPKTKKEDVGNYSPDLLNEDPVINLISDDEEASQNDFPSTQLTENALIVKGKISVTPTRSVSSTQSPQVSPLRWEIPNKASKEPIEILDSPSSQHSPRRAENPFAHLLTPKETKDENEEEISKNTKIKNLEASPMSKTTPRAHRLEERPLFNVQVNNARHASPLQVDPFGDMLTPIKTDDENSQRFTQIEEFESPEKPKPTPKAFSSEKWQSGYLPDFMTFLDNQCTSPGRKADASKTELGPTSIGRNRHENKPSEKYTKTLSIEDASDPELPELPPPRPKRRHQALTEEITDFSDTEMQPNKPCNDDEITEFTDSEKDSPPKPKRKRPSFSHIGRSREKRKRRSSNVPDLVFKRRRTDLFTPQKSNGHKFADSMRMMNAMTEEDPLQEFEDTETWSQKVHCYEFPKEIRPVPQPPRQVNTWLDKLPDPSPNPKRAIELYNADNNRPKKRKKETKGPLTTMVEQAIRRNQASYQRNQIAIPGIIKSSKHLVVRVLKVQNDLLNVPYDVTPTVCCRMSGSGLDHLIALFPKRLFLEKDIRALDFLLLKHDFRELSFQHRLPIFENIFHFEKLTDSKLPENSHSYPTICKIDVDDVHYSSTRQRPSRNTASVAGLIQRVRTIDEFGVYLVQSGRRLVRIFIPKYMISKEKVEKLNCSFTGLNTISNGKNRANNVSNGTLFHMLTSEENGSLDLLEIEKARKHGHSCIPSYEYTIHSTYEILEEENDTYHAPRFFDLRSILDESSNPGSLKVGRVSLKGLVVKQTDICMYISDSTLNHSMKVVPLTFSAYDLKQDYTGRHCLFEDVLLFAKPKCISLRLDEYSELQLAESEKFCLFDGSLLNFLAPTSFLKHHSLRIPACLFRCSGKIVKLACHTDEKWSHLATKEPGLIDHYRFWSFVLFTIQVGDFHMEELEIPLSTLVEAVPEAILTRSKDDIFRYLSPYTFQFIVEWFHSSSKHLRVLHMDLAPT